MTNITTYHCEEKPDGMVVCTPEAQRKAVEWSELTDQSLRLRCGELTAQEIRTIRAVLGAILSLPNAIVLAQPRENSTNTKNDQTT